jgi:hypothetical protein
MFFSYQSLAVLGMELELGEVKELHFVNPTEPLYCYSSCLQQPV